MNIKFVSLCNEKDNNHYPESYIGKMVTRHDVAGIVFDDIDEATEHQGYLLEKDRGGIIAVRYFDDPIKIIHNTRS